MKIAAASCAKLQQTNPQPAWREIENERPDALILLGDNVYLDHDNHDDPAALAAELSSRYVAQFAEPNFASLMSSMKARGAPVIAIYDDHDFLGNNRYGGDCSTSLRQAARAEFIKVFAPSMTGSDVYSARDLGNVRLIVLDERFYRRSPCVSCGDRDAILGAEQWSWLEAQLSSHAPAFTVIVSSTTFHTFGDESWEQYPTAFGRLRDLLKGRKGALILSGDVHRNAVYDDSGVIEVVTSAVARNGIVFGAPRRNYAILTFGDDAVRIDLRSLKASWRFNFSVPLSAWVLP